MARLLMGLVQPRSPGCHVMGLFATDSINGVVGYRQRFHSELARASVRSSGLWCKTGDESSTCASRGPAPRRCVLEPLLVRPDEMAAVGEVPAGREFGDGE